MWRCRAATLPYTVLCEAVKPYMSKETRKYRSKFCSCTFEVMACVKQEVGLFSDGDARTLYTSALRTVSTFLMVHGYAKTKKELCGHVCICAFLAVYLYSE